MAESNQPVKSELLVNGRKWKLKKAALDSGINFAFEKFVKTSFSCQRINDKYFAILIGGFTRPSPYTNERPEDILMLTFSPFAVKEDMTNMCMRFSHIYSSEPMMAEEFAHYFLKPDTEEQDIKLSPYPDMDNNKGDSDGRTEQTDEE